jgi:hypothetical protein
LLFADGPGQGVLFAFLAVERREVERVVGAVEFFGASSSTSTGVGSGRSLCRVAARSRSCCTDRHTSRKRCIGGRKR